MSDSKLKKDPEIPILKRKVTELERRCLRLEATVRDLERLLKKLDRSRRSQQLKEELGGLGPTLPMQLQKII